MNRHKIPYKQTSFFSKIVEDYLDGELSNVFYNRVPFLDNISDQIEQKRLQDINRELLFEVLKTQNLEIKLTKKSENNIVLIKEKNTYTITTGHQPCLFSGPLYFLYKIISTVNLTEKLTREFPQNNFVPIFWIASEDHDFQEVNHIHLFGKKYEWIIDQNGGMVGNFDTSDIDKVINQISSVIGDSKNSKRLIDLFKRCYKENTLTEATRILVNELFGKYGIVILDASDIRLKQQLIPIIKKDVVHQSLYKIMSASSDSLSESYKVQALVRKINFFKLSKGKRDRIVRRVSEKEVDSFPESFSPNVLMRPLYQELILPNLAYIGGGSEIAYWMQLKGVFEEMNIVFPMIVLRNSVMWIQEKDYLRWIELGFEINDIFLPEQEIYKKFIKKQTNFNLDYEKIELENLFNSLSQKTRDEGIKSLIRSKLQHELKFLKKMEKKILKHEKLKYETTLNQIRKIKYKLFPNDILQERFDNFISYYSLYGEEFIKILKEEIDPLDTNFLILSPKKNKV